jgi:DHA2 family multidrug resistance protein-like MFS transporter
MSTPDEALGRRSSAAVACVLAALVLVVLDATIANVALPAIALSLHATPAESVRMVTAYQVALVMALFPSAALGERFGHRRVYTAGVGLFVGAAVACALAPSLPCLVLARFVQGLGGAAVMALGVALLRQVVPERRLGSALGWNALAIALSSAAGPTLGGLVLSAASWPWLFALDLPVGALVLLATRALPRATGSPRKLDLVSAALNAASFGALVLGAELLPHSLTSAVAVLAAGAVATLALVRRELLQTAPLVPIDLLRNRSFRLSVVASVCCFVGQSAAMVSLPFYLQHGLGLDVLRTSLFITPWPLTVALAAPLAGRLADRISGARLCAVGGALLAVGLASAALVPLHGSPLPLVPALVLSGLGFGLFQVPNNRNMLLATPRARSAAAGSMQGTARLSGQTIGGVLMTLLFANASPELAPRLALGGAALLTLAAGLVSTLRAGPEARTRGVRDRARVDLRPSPISP